MEQFANTANTTLSGSITNVATTLVVTSATGFPSTGNFRIVVDSGSNLEYMLVTGVSGTTFTVTRGQESTTNVAHNSGVLVTHILTAGALVQLKSDVTAGVASAGLSTARPSATGSGKFYLCTDIPVFYFDDPNTTLWKQFATEYLPAPAAATSYTTVGNISLSQNADTIRALCTSNASSQSGAGLISQTLSSSSPWSITLVFAANLAIVTNGADGTIGVIVTNGTVNGTSTCYGIWLITSNASPGLGWISSAQSGGTSTLGGTYTGAPSINYSGSVICPIGTGKVHFRLLADGTNLHYQYSQDGFQWADVASVATPSGLTDYGFTLGNYGGAVGGYSQALIFENAYNSAPLQYTITNNTAANPSVVTIGTHTIQAGDIVAIHGATTNLNSGTGNLALAGGWLVTAIGSTTITVSVTSTPAAGSAGTVTLLSR